MIYCWLFVLVIKADLVMFPSSDTWQRVMYQFQLYCTRRRYGRIRHLVSYSKEVDLIGSFAAVFLQMPTAGIVPLGLS